MKKTATQSLSKQAMVLIMARGISFLVTLGIPLILVRYLTQAEFGAYKQSILLYTTAVTLLPWGMSQSLYYFIPQDPKDRGGYLANSFLFLVGIGILSLVGFSFAGPTLQHYFHSTELANSAMIIGIYLFFMISSIHWEIVLVADNRAKEAAGVILLNETFKAVALIGSALIWHSFTGIMTAIAVAAAIRFFLLGAYFFQDLKVVLKGPNLLLLRKQWSYAMPFGLISVLSFSQDYFHQYYVSYSFSPADFAIYAVGCLQLPLIDLFYSSIGDVAMVKMAEHLRIQDIVGLRNVWHDAMLKLAIIFLPMMIYLVIVSNLFITTLFTQNYQASVPIFIVSTIGMFLSALLFVDPVMRVFGEMRFMLIITILRLPVTFTLVVGALTLFGMIGVAATTIISILLVRAIILIKISRIMQVGIKAILPWPSLGRILLAALSAALPTVLIINLPLSAKSLLLITALVYGLVFLLAGLALNIFPLEERKMVRDFWDKNSRWLITSFAKEPESKETQSL